MRFIRMFASFVPTSLLLLATDLTRRDGVIGSRIELMYIHDREITWLGKQGLLWITMLLLLLIFRSMENIQKLEKENLFFFCPKLKSRQLSLALTNYLGIRYKKKVKFKDVITLLYIDSNIKGESVGRYSCMTVYIFYVQINQHRCS